MAAIIPGNSITDIGKSGSPWAAGYFTALKVNGQDVVATNDARIPTSDQKGALAGSDGTPSSSNRFVTASDRARLWMLTSVTGLTGGGSTKLDGYITAGVTAGLVVGLVDANGGSPLFRAYQLTAANTAESSPNVIRPDDYASTTNEKVWLLVSTATSADALAVSFDPDFYTPALATLAAHLEGIDDVLGSVLTSRTGVYRELFKGVHEMMANTGTPTLGAITVGSLKLQAVTLPNDATRSVQVVMRLPDSWDITADPKIKLEWSAAAAGDVRFEVSLSLFTGGDGLTAPLGTATGFVDTTAAADTLEITPATQPAPAGEGRFAVIEIARIGAHASDTIAGNVYLLGVRLQYLENDTEPVTW